MIEKFDYAATIKGIVLKSLEKVGQEAALENTSNVFDHVAVYPKDNDDRPVNIKLPALEYTYYYLLLVLILSKLSVLACTKYAKILYSITTNIHLW